MNKKLIQCSLLLVVSATLLTGCKKKDDAKTISIKNLYFSSWDGSDPYTKVIENKFDVKIKPASYTYSDWGEQVQRNVEANKLPDVFHFDLESFNYGNTYKEWAQGGIIKAIPDDLSRWPKVKNIVDNTSNVNSLKIGGKLYGIPLAYNQDDPGKTYSSFTYVYRRDWVKSIDQKNEGKAGYVPLYHENDVYEFDEFLRILRAFKSEIPSVHSGDWSAIADTYWGFPSVTNFFKSSPHCYTYNESGKVVNAFATDKYIDGLDITRQLVIEDKLYFDQVTNNKNTKSYDSYKAGNVGVYYENLSLSNYTNLRKDYLKNHASISKAELNDATAIMKVKGPDHKFHLEGSENWFSMTFFNYDMPDSKMEKFLDILDYLLGEEGTKLAIYGIEGTDYFVNDGDIELNPSNWIKQTNGEYAPIVNGAKFLRETITLNNDTSAFDPFTDLESYQILKAWQDEMNQAKRDGNLVIFEEPGELKWLSTPMKDYQTSALITEGNNFAMNYSYADSEFATRADYKKKFDTSKWNDTLAEINQYLGR